MSNITLPFDIESLEILAQHIDSKGNITLEVRSKRTNSTCHKCGKSATKPYGTAPEITVQHTSILDRPVYLKIKPVRYQCEHCDDHPTTTEQYGWCDRNAKVTHALEEYIMRNLINSTVRDVSRKIQIGEKTIVRALERKVDQSVDWSDYGSFPTLGIDEVAIKKGHQDYLTVVSAKQSDDSLSVLAVIKGRKKKDVLAFFNSIPEHLRKSVNQVCTDMYEGFVNAAIEVFGQQKVVVDRYHVSKQYRKPLDELRIKEMKRLKSVLSKEEYAELKDMMWILRRKHECLSEADKSKLSLLYQHSPILKRAHKLAIKLTHIFNTHQTRKSGIAKLNRWIRSVQKSGLTCFDTFIVTLQKHKPSIANYFKNRSNSGFVEGLNNKIKVVKRRCYGFFKEASLFQRLQLDLRGYDQYGLQIS